MDNWLDNYEPDLPRGTKSEREKLTDYTGNVPLILRELIGCGGNIEDAWIKLTESEFVSTIYRNLHDFTASKIEKETTDIRDRYRDLMLSFLYHEEVLSGPGRYDHRYFYVEDGEGRYVCGFVREYMLSILTEEFGFGHVFSSK